MIILLMLPFLLGNFVQKWFIPNGMIGECGRLLICDTDRDGNCEFFMPPYGGAQKIYIYELHLPDTWQVDSFPYLYSPLMWDVGDFDLDGFADIVIEASATQGYPTMVISVAEAPDSFSCPTQEVWRDTIGVPLVIPVCVFDVDEDGIPEIVDGNGNGATDFNVFESIGDNTYELIFTGYPPFYSSSTFAFGDYDGDNANEFIFGSLDGWYAVYECNGNNSYVETHIERLSTFNIKDCFTVPEADGDGKLEFVVKGYVIPSAQIHAFIFEAIGDNTYEIVKTFALYGGDYYGGYSDVGDVDGDGIPEIALEGCQNIYIIKAADNDSFYVWETLPGNSSGSSVRVYDIDGNGFSEVVISGNNQTRIYEYEVGIAEETRYQIQETEFEIYPIPIHDKVNIEYVLSKHSEVNISLFDATGSLIKELVNKSQGAGNYCELFDLADLSQGVYFTKLHTGDTRETKKVVLLK